ncbi:MAG: zinc-finger domain-containing protein [Rickettsiales bacterium]
MFETIEVSTEEVICDGGGSALGHPRVYLHIDHDDGNKVVCGYCSRTYVLRADKVA